MLPDSKALVVVEVALLLETSRPLVFELDLDHEPVTCDDADVIDVIDDIDENGKEKGKSNWLT